jgi:hypothetical protein
VLAPSTETAFDDLTTWTGSVARDDDGVWWMFYVGASRADDGRAQRIGAATSSDPSIRIERRDLPVEADPRWVAVAGPRSVASGTSRASRGLDGDLPRNRDVQGRGAVRVWWGWGRRREVT